MAKRTKKLSRPQLKLEALEQRQLLAGVTGGGTEVGSNINHSNGNVYDQVLMTGSSVTITADAGQVTRVSFLDLQGDIVQAEFSGKGQLTISLDQFTKDVAPANYNQAGVKYSQGLASFTVSGSDSSTNFAVFSVGKGNAVNQALFDTTHQGGDHIADIARLTIVADPANPNGSDFGAIYAGNAKFSADSGVVGITASNVQVQNAVRIGDVDAKTSATPTLVFGTHSQFAAIDVAGGDLISTNGKSVNNKLSYEYGVNLLAGTDSSGTTLPAQIVVPPFTDHDPFAGTAAKTLSLTSGNDVGSLFTGTAGDDTYIAAIGSNGVPTNGTTLNPGDALNGGGGIDTLSLSISGTNTANQTTASFTANNLEKLSIANFQTDDAFNSTVDLASVPNLTTVEVTSSSASGDTILSSVQAIVGASMKNGAGDLTLTYASAVVAGSADVQALTVAGQTAGTFTADGIETLNITSNTADNTLGVSGAQLKTITVTGDKGIDLGNLTSATSVTKVDASGLTAGVLKIDANQAKDYNLIGGAGNDSITISTGYSSADSVNGGAGADTLSIAATLASSDDLKNVSNVETLKVTGANSITLAANVGPTTFDLSDKTAQTLNLTTTVTTKYTNDTWVTLTGDAGAGDKINNAANVALVVNANTTDVVAATTIIGGTGSDTLNLAAKGAGSLANVSGVEKINITGSTASTINGFGGDGVVASGKTLTIDGSAASAALTIDATGETNGMLSITTGSGKDVITAGSSGKDTVVTGSGDDKITIGAITATNVIDGGAGSDQLTVSGTDIADAGKLVGVTGIETLRLGDNVDLTLAAPITATTGITKIAIGDVNTSPNVITLKSGFTDALTVDLSGDGNIANKVDNQANVALTVVGGVADVGANVTIKGGSGTDVLNLKAGNNTTATLTNVSGVESVVIGQDNDHPDYAVTVTMGANDTQIAAGKTLTVDASALTNSAAVFTFNGTSSETDGFVSVVGSSGADVISGTSSGFDTLIGGAGNDAITLGALNATNMVSGGDGDDSLAVTTDIATSSAFLGVTGIETLKLGASTDVTLTSNIKSSSGIATIDAGNASNNVITIAAGVTDTINVVLTGDGGGGDKIVNSANTTLTVSAGLVDVDANTTITGGTGSDSITLKGTANAQTATLSAVTGVETVTVAKSGFTGSVVVGADAVVAAGKTLTIDASGADAALTLDGSAETDGSLVLKGSSGNDTIIGGGAADTFSGGDGNDVFTVSKHTNKLTFDVVTDAKTNDILSTSDMGTEVFGATEKVKISLGGLATFSDYLDAAAAGDGHTNGIYRWFQYGGNTYLVFDVSASSAFQSNADMVIQLNGDVDLSKATLGDHQLTLG